MSGEEILRIATAEIGTHAEPVNRVKYNEWYYGKSVSGKSYPWCMAFVQWIYDQAGIPLPLRTASCGGLLRWYKRNQPECITDNPVRGCVVIFDFPGNSDTDHTGLFVKLENGKITTIDGNTSSNSDASGGCVQQRTRTIDYAKPTYIVPRELEEAVERFNTIREISDNCPWATETVAKLISKDCIRGNGQKDSQGRPADMDLSRDMLRLLVINDRAGLYG